MPTVEFTILKLCRLAAEIKPEPSNRVGFIKIVFGAGRHFATSDSSAR